MRSKQTDVESHGHQDMEVVPYGDFDGPWVRVWADEWGGGSRWGDCRGGTPTLS
jgi:hypothetical protein